MGFLERLFDLRAAGTTVRREVVAGLVTFVTLSYVLFVQPAVLSDPACGMDPEGVLFATCVASAVGCFAMAWLANYPIALAPAMGHNFFFVFTVCLGLGFTWQQALAANLLAGGAFLALSGTRLRERVMEAVPEPLRHAIAAGIGLLIALVGLRWGGLVVDHPVTLVALGDLGRPVPLLTIFGLALIAVLVARGVRAAILIGVGASAVVGWVASRALDLSPALVEWHGVVGAPPSPQGTAFRLDFVGLFERPWSDWLSVLLVFFLLDLFDTVGTLIGVCGRAGLLVEGRLPRARGALAADAVGTVVGAALGTSTVTSYVESSAGVEAGGRTGLTAAVVGVCMLGALVLSPLVRTVGAGVVVATEPLVLVQYPLIAPVLILIGAFMLGSLRNVEWRDPTQSIPAFLTVVMMQLGLSISDGLAWGFVSYSLLMLATGRVRDTSPWVHGIALVFLARMVLSA